MAHGDGRTEKQQRNKYGGIMEEENTIKQQAINILQTIFDPEIPVNIYELGLIYDVIVDAEDNITVKFSLTSPNCPAAQSLPGEMETKLKTIIGVGKVTMELVWEPTWGPEKMSEAARLQLGMF